MNSEQTKNNEPHEVSPPTCENLKILLENIQSHIQNKPNRSDFCEGEQELYSNSVIYHDAQLHMLTSLYERIYKMNNTKIEKAKLPATKTSFWSDFSILGFLFGNAFLKPLSVDFSASEESEKIPDIIVQGFITNLTIIIKDAQKIDPRSTDDKKLLADQEYNRRIQMVVSNFEKTLDHYQKQSEERIKKHVETIKGELAAQENSNSWRYKMLRGLCFTAIVVILIINFHAHPDAIGQCIAALIKAWQYLR